MGTALAESTIANTLLRRVREWSPNNVARFQVASLRDNSISSFVLDRHGLQTSNSREFRAPTTLTASNDGRFLFAASALRDELAAFRKETDGSLTLLQAVPTGTSPESLIFCSQRRLLFVSNGLQNSVTAYVVGENGELTEGSECRVGAAPRGMALHPDGHTLCVCTRSEDSVSFLNISEDGLEEFARITSGPNPSEALFSRDGHCLYILEDGRSLSIWRREENGRWHRNMTATLGSGATSMLLAEDGASLYITHTNEGYIAHYRLQNGIPTFCSTLDCEGGPVTLASVPEQNSIYAVCLLNNSITRFSVEQLGHLINPLSIEIDRGSGQAVRR